MNRVDFVGIKELDEFDQKRIKDIVEKEISHLDYIFGRINALKIHFKKHSQTGNKHKYSVHILIDSPGQPMAVSDHTEDWDVVNSLHKALDKTKELIKKRNRMSE